MLSAYTTLPSVERCDDWKVPRGCGLPTGPNRACLIARPDPIASRSGLVQPAFIRRARGVAHQLGLSAARTPDKRFFVRAQQPRYLCSHHP